MDTFISDLRYSLRSLRRHPAFSIVAVFVLAVGIGSSTAIFSIVNKVLLRPLPFPSAARLVEVTSVSRQGDGLSSYPDFQDLRARNHSFRYLAAYHEDSWTLTTAGAPAINLSIGVASANLFPMLGIQPILGRVFTPKEDEDTTGDMSILISANSWRNQFGSDPRILGKPITLRGLRYTVIGVMPATFNFPLRAKPFDGWTTFGYSDYLRSPVPWPRERGTHFLNVGGELAPGITTRQAEQELSTICASLAMAYPATNRYRTVRVQTLLDWLTQKQKPVFRLLLAAAACLLLVACANVANLSLLRASTRRRELVIRAAFGADGLRIVRQVLVESLVLSVIGGVAGLMIGVLTSGLFTRMLTHFSPLDVPRLGDSGFDLTVFFFALGASLLTGIAIGIPPAIRSARQYPAAALKENSLGATEGVGGNRTRNVLVIGEIATTLILLSCTGLLIRSLSRLNSVDPGFQSQNAITAQLTFPAAKFSERGFSETMNLLEARLRSLPGVVAASDAAVLPLRGDSMSTSFEIQGHPLPKSERPNTRANIVGGKYLETMGIPLLSGRDLALTDTSQTPKVILVNEAFARQYFPDKSAVGQQIRCGIGLWGEKEHPFRLIVGIVGPVAQDRIGQPSLPELYFPRDQLPFDFATLVVKTRSDSRDYLPLIQSTFQSIDPDIPLDEVHTLDELVAISLAQPRFVSLLLLVFSSIALLFTAVGLYGVVAYSVSQRTRELAMRRALGARMGHILILILRRGLALTMTGILIGTFGALASSRILRLLLYGISPSDPVTLMSVAVLVFIVALVATVVPALRAIRLDPVSVLRCE